MKCIPCLVVSVMLFGMSSMSLFGDNEKRDAEGADRERALRNEQVDGSQAEWVERIKRKMAEMEKLAKQLATAGKQQEAEDVLEQLIDLRERIPKALLIDERPTDNNALATLKIDEQLLLERYGPEHPKVKDLRKRIEFMGQEAGENERLVNLKVDLQMLLQKYGPEHPKVKELKKRIEMVRESIEQEATRPNRTDVEQKEGNEAQRRLQHLRAAAENLEAAGLREQAEQIRKQIELAEAANRGPAGNSPEVRELHNQVRQLKERIEQLEGLVRRLAQQNEQLQTQSKASAEQRR
jgi:uncharacterized protein involved in exopolysaccharide biosynthesis